MLCGVYFMVIFSLPVSCPNGFRITKAKQKANMDLPESG